MYMKFSSSAQWRSGVQLENGVQFQTRRALKEKNKWSNVDPAIFFILL